MGTAFQNLNWLAILMAALSTFVIGGLWYSPLLFMNAWLESIGYTKENIPKRNPALVFGLTFVFSFLMAFNLAMFIGNSTALFGMMAGLLAGLGWVSFAIAILALFEHRSLKWVLINGGYMVVAFTVMGLILGAWK